MLRARTGLLVATLSFPVFLAACGDGGGAGSSSAPAKYDDLVALFKEWRTFQQPTLVDGVPDYRSNAMSEQHRALATYQQRLRGMNISGWPIPQQVDWHIVRAEMNGLDFDHRVLKPWVNDPAFYVTVFPDESDQPAREGPWARGSTELWKYAWPLDAAAEKEIHTGLSAIPSLLDQARANLTGTGKDLWTFGTRLVRAQSGDLDTFAAKLTDARHADLRADVGRAKTATDKFVEWLDQQAPNKTGPSGVGIETFDWYLKHVMLVPHTWHDEVTLIERELAHAHASLALEELRNASLPPNDPIATAEEYDQRAQAGVTQYMKFLQDHEILTVRDWMDGALRARLGRFNPGPREFFGEIDARDPEVMRTHGYHWFDKGWMVHRPHPSPIRRDALLYNIFISRTEGHATGWEEMMMKAGMFDRRPRTRELIYVLLAQRGARALGDLRQHGRVMTLDQAAVFTSANTPRNWLRLEATLVRWEQHLYLRQPGYGTSYVIGKMQIERLLQDRKRQLGDKFTMKQFMDEFDAVGLIPISLVRWEMTGELPDDLRALFELPR